MGSPGSAECAESLDLAERTCDTLGVPLALEKRGTNPSAGLSGHRARFQQTGAAAPGEEAYAPLQDGTGMADEAVVHKKGAAVLNWAAAACHTSGKTRSTVPASNDQPGGVGQGTASSHQIARGV